LTHKQGFAGTKGTPNESQLPARYFQAEILQPESLGIGLIGFTPGPTQCRVVKVDNAVRIWHGFVHILLRLNSIRFWPVQESYQPVKRDQSSEQILNKARDELQATLNATKYGQCDKGFGWLERFAEDSGVKEKDDEDGEGGKLIRKDIVERAEGESPSLPGHLNMAEAFNTGAEKRFESVELRSAWRSRPLTLMTL